MQIVLEKLKLFSVFQARPTMYNVVKEMIDKMGYKVRLVMLSCSHLNTDLNRRLLFDDYVLSISRSSLFE